MQTTKTKPTNSATMTRRIGSTVYNVTIHFSETSKEDMNDKIIRLIKNDPELRKAAV